MYEKAMNEKKNELITRAEEVVNKAKLENRELTDAEAAELAEIRDNIRRIMKTLEITDDIDRAKCTEKKREAGEAEEKTEEETAAEIAEQETRAFEYYIRAMAMGKNPATNERANNMTFDDNGAVDRKSVV